MTRRPEQETHTNGIDREAAFDSAVRRFNTSRPETQGYFLLIGGSLLFLFSIGLLPILKWVMVAGSLALAFWGAMKIRLVHKVRNLINDFQASRSKK